MTQYLETFAGMDANTGNGYLFTPKYPTNFTNRWEAEDSGFIDKYGWNVYTGDSTITYSDDRYIKRHNHSQGAGKYLLSFDDVDSDSNRANCHVRMLHHSDSINTYPLGLAVRASGSSGSESGYLIYLTYVSPDWKLKIARLDSGTETSLATSSDPLDDAHISDLDWYAEVFDSFPDSFVNLEVQVTDPDSSTVRIKAKVWAEGYNKFDGWTVEHDDTSANRITANGWIGFYNSYTDYRIIDHISVGTNGDTPLELSGNTGNVHLHQATLEVLGSKSTFSPTVETYTKPLQQVYNCTVGELWGGYYYGYQQAYRWYYENEPSNYSPEKVGRLEPAEIDYGTSDPLRPLIYLHDPFDPNTILTYEFTRAYSIWDASRGYYRGFEFRFEASNYLDYSWLQSPVTDRAFFYHKDRQGFSTFNWVDIETASGLVRLSTDDVRDGGDLASAWLSPRRDYQNDLIQSITLNFITSNAIDLWDTNDVGLTRQITFEGQLPEEPAVHYYRVRTTMP